MSSKLDRDRVKVLQDKHQGILCDLLKDDDNKYCVDCDAKGPRWASWNLGVFLCIRCAGIHRNLGVHISKVKSVNLDSWTSEQIAMVQEIGNSRGRAIYEANLPDNMRRPQTDSGLEAFIRAKYEQKKYIAKEWVQPHPTIHYPKEDVKSEKKPPHSKSSSAGQLSRPPVKPGANNSRKSEAKSGSSGSRGNQQAEPVKPAEPVMPAAPSVDLLGLGTDMATPTSQPSLVSEDLFGDFISTPAIGGAASGAVMQGSETTPGSDLFEEGSAAVEAEPKKSAKESIMALYGPSASSGSQQQMFGIPGGMYMPQQQVMPGGGMPNGLLGGSMMPPPANMGMMPANAAANGMMGAAMPMQMPGMPAGMYGMPAVPMPQQQGMMMAGAAGGYMYNPPQQQQQQFQQMQNQMGGMSLGSQPTPQQAATGWGGMQPATGHTLSTNLWQ